VVRFSQRDSTLTFAVRVVPRASRSEFAGEHEGALRVRIAASAIEGAANRELVRLLAKRFRLPQKAIEIVSGAKSKTKLVRVHGTDAAQLEQLLNAK